MIYALDKIAPGMANIDTLLYGVEVKFYNSRVDVDENLETAVKVFTSLATAQALRTLCRRLLHQEYLPQGLFQKKFN